MNTYMISGLVYLTLTVLFGMWMSKKTQSSMSGYYLGDRSIGKVAGALSGSASSESAWVMMGLAGAAYTSGISVLWLIPGCILGYAFNWFVLAPKINRESRIESAYSIPELVGKKTDSKELRLLLSVIISALLIAYISAQFLAIGKTINQLSDIDSQTGIFVGSAVVALYIGFGGLKASVYSDVIQSLLMVAALLFVPIYCLFLIPVYGQPDIVLPEGFFSMTGASQGFAIVGLILGWSGIGLAYPGQAHIHSRFFAMREDADMKSAGFIAISWSTLVFTGAIIAGVAGRHLIPDLAGAESELVLVQLAYNYMPAVVGGVIIAAILCAIASTADSQLLTASNTIKNDLLRFTSMQINPRIITLLIALAATFFASTNNATIFDLVLNAWQVLGVTVGIALIGALIFNTTANAIFFSMGLALLALFAWKHSPLSAHLYHMVPAMTVGLIAIYLSKKSEKA